KSEPILLVHFLGVNSIATFHISAYSFLLRLVFSVRSPQHHFHYRHLGEYFVCLKVLYSYLLNSSWLRWLSGQCISQICPALCVSNPVRPLQCRIKMPPIIHCVRHAQVWSLILRIGCGTDGRR